MELTLFNNSELIISPISSLTSLVSSVSEIIASLTFLLRCMLWDLVSSAVNTVVVSLLLVSSDTFELIDDRCSLFLGITSFPEIVV